MQLARASQVCLALTKKIRDAVRGKTIEDNRGDVSLGGAPENFVLGAIAHRRKSESKSILSGVHVLRFQCQRWIRRGISLAGESEVRGIGLPVTEFQFAAHRREYSCSRDALKMCLTESAEKDYYCKTASRGSSAAESATMGESSSRANRGNNAEEYRAEIMTRAGTWRDRQDLEAPRRFMRPAARYRKTLMQLARASQVCLALTKKIRDAVRGKTIEDNRGDVSMRLVQESCWDYGKFRTADPDLVVDLSAREFRAGCNCPPARVRIQDYPRLLREFSVKGGLDAEYPSRSSWAPRNKGAESKSGGICVMKAASKTYMHKNLKATTRSCGLLEFSQNELR
ncbi:hypothetical protein FB451DRAFT_1191615 [Mycena latifolia]|nr:hypothetical protein FB451DRAFT_1191615 [Mycena latifolia]